MFQSDIKGLRLSGVWLVDKIYADAVTVAHLSDTLHCHLDKCFASDFSENKT